MSRSGKHNGIGGCRRIGVSGRGWGRSWPFRLLAAGARAGVLAVDAPAAVLHVPAEYPTIQAALNAAANTGDEILVAPGTYREAINYHGKAV